jgi:hypothetical protein
MQSSTSSSKYQDLLFHELASIVLASFIGVLIVVPYATILVSNEQRALSLITLLTGAVVGFLVGKRRCKSRLFMYFCMLVVIILSTIIGYSSSQ